MLRVREILKIEKDVLGPDERVGIWFQGCSIKCKDCMVPETWEFNGGKLYSAYDLSKEVKAFGLKEVTLSGGEPFDQNPDVLFEFLSILKDDNFGILCYSGYYFEELIKKGFAEHLKLIDLLIDGRYIKIYDRGTPWRGSDNQRFIILSDRYKDVILPQKRKIQILVYENRFQVVGIANMNTICYLQKYFLKAL